MLILPHYIRFATKNSPKNTKIAIKDMVQRLIAPNERAIKSMIGPKAITAAYR